MAGIGKRFRREHGSNWQRLFRRDVSDSIVGIVPAWQRLLGVLAKQCRYEEFCAMASLTPFVRVLP
jgi:hypothetical protein